MATCRLLSRRPSVAMCFRSVPLLPAIQVRLQCRNSPTLRPSLVMCFRSVPMLLVIQLRLHCRTSPTIRPSVVMCFRSVPMLLVIQVRLHCHTSPTRILKEWIHLNCYPSVIPSQCAIVPVRCLSSRHTRILKEYKRARKGGGEAAERGLQNEFGDEAR